MLGWQLMSLKSGHLGGLNVSRNAVLQAGKFLDRVQGDDYGGVYGYNKPGSGRATTAVGLLCRMVSGWGRNHPGIVAGVAKLSEWGPSRTDMYYNYYATQVLFHYTGGRGKRWLAWDKPMRELLLASQAKEGHAAGSWSFGKGHLSRGGGRLGDTCFAAMILEVYYRFSPIYSTKAVDGEFDASALDN